MTDGFLQSYLPYLLHRTDQLLSARFHRALHPRGVSVSEWRILAVLRETPAATITELAERTMLPQPTTTHAVGRLETGALVERTASTVDRRRRLVNLTSNGRQLADELVVAASAELDAAPVERRRLQALERELRQLLSDIDRG